MHDIIVVGGGPAGLTAALYGLRNGKSVVTVEKSVFGGQITNSPKVENIPGFASIGGDEFAEKYLDQVIGQGGEAEFAEVKGVTPLEDRFEVRLDDGRVLEGKSVILATGTRHRVTGLPGEEELIGNGVHFCAVCDGDFYSEKTVCIIGGGNSAFVEAVLLAEICEKLIILQDMPFFTADQKLQDQLFANGNIETHTGTRILGYVQENGVLRGVRYEENGEEKTADCAGVFLAIGLVPDNDAFASCAELDERGYFSAGEDCRTRTPGLFVAGDCRTKSLRQVTTACGDGAVAAIAACEYLRGK